MAVSENVGGTQTATGGEDVLATIAVGGTYQLEVDLNEMVNDDTLTLRIYSKVRAASVSRVVFIATFSNAPGADAMIVASPPIGEPFEFKATLEEEGGSLNDYIWSIREY